MNTGISIILKKMDKNKANLDNTCGNSCMSYSGLGLGG